MFITLDSGESLRVRTVSFDALEVGANLRGMLVTQLAIFLQALGDYVFQLRRNVWIQADGSNRHGVKQGIEHVGRGTATERQQPSHHLVKDDAKREQIGARIQ